MQLTIPSQVDAITRHAASLRHWESELGSRHFLMEGLAFDSCDVMGIDPAALVLEMSCPVIGAFPFNYIDL